MAQDSENLKDAIDQKREETRQLKQQLRDIKPPEKKKQGGCKCVLF
jgi:hypothetical protein